MSERLRNRWWISAALVAGILLAASHRTCWAETLPRPAARFIQFYERSAVVVEAETEKVGWWERFLFSLILASTAPTVGETSTSS